MLNPKRLAAALLVTSVSFAAPDMPRKVVLRGTLSVVQEDDFAHGRTARVHTLLDDESGGAFTLRLSASTDLRLRTGSRVVVRGTALGREVELDQPLEVLAAADAPAMDARRVVVIVADFADSAVTCTNESIAGLMWTGPMSVDGLYQAASFGQVSVPNDVDNNGASDVVRVSIPNIALDEGCDPYTWAANAETAAQDAGVDLGLYQHKVIVLPSNIACGWAGLGNVGCSGGSCRAWVKTCDLQDVYAHEIGHNLDMAHASTDTNNDGTVDCEYCDMSDIMGYGGVGWRLFSSGHEGQKGWIPSNKIQQVTVAGPATYVLSPLQLNPADAPYPQILKIQTPVTGDFYYVSYRQKQGYDAALSSEYADRANIHRYAGSGYANTKYLASLMDTQYFDDPQNGFQIRQISHDGMSVTVQVTTSCVHVAPTVTMSPARQNGVPGQELAYTFAVTNRDPINCASQVFNVTTTVPAGFTSTLSFPSLNLSPGVQGMLTMRVTSPLSAPVGDATVSATTFGATASAVYAVAAANSAPTAVTLSATVGKKGALNLVWTASTDSNGIASYRVMRNGVQIAQVTSRTYVAAKPTAAGVYDFTVVAVDTTGLVSAPSNAYRVTVASTGGGGKPPRHLN